MCYAYVSKQTTKGHTVASMSKKGKQGAANLALALAMQEKRRSGAAGTHADKRTKRNRTRSAQRARAIREW
jgi:hypothetical protein